MSAMKKILIVLLVAFVIIQFFPIDKTNPPVTKGMDFLISKQTPEPIAQKIRNSCYDCHSNESRYPWYAYVQPTAWLLKKHIEDARTKLNFSTFATYEPKRQAHKLEESAEEIENGNMPMESYLLGHPEAKFSPEDMKMVVDYFKKVEMETRIKYNLQLH